MSKPSSLTLPELLRLSSGIAADYGLSAEHAAEVVDRVLTAVQAPGFNSARACEHCGRPNRRKSKWCSDACKLGGWRAAQKATGGEGA